MKEGIHKRQSLYKVSALQTTWNTSYLKIQKQEKKHETSNINWHISDYTVKIPW